jgi:hypothetical protein
MRTFSVKNFDRFQHYKDRSPPWIKLYNELLDDYAFSTLSDASKFHLVAIWLLASRTENKIPHDPMWIASRINAKNRVDLDALERAGFIVVDQDAPQGADDVAQDASKPLDQRQRESQRQSREETDSRDAEFEGFWEVYPLKAGKKDARAAFLKARKKIEFTDLLAAVRRIPAPSDPKYYPHASTWLNGERWNDAPPSKLTAQAALPNGSLWQQRMATYRPGKFWPSSWGPPPDDPMCECPAEILTEWKRRLERAA